MGKQPNFFSWKIKDSRFGLSKSLHFFRRKGWWIGNSPWLGDSNENPYPSWTLFATFWLGLWKGALPFGLGKPWAAHECDLRQVLQDGISVGYLQLGLRLFHSNPKSSNKITVMDWMLHRTDALLIHVFYIYFQSKRTPSKWNFGLATAEVGGRLEISDQHVQMRFSPMPVLASSVCSVGIAILFSGIQAWQN